MTKHNDEDDYDFAITGCPGNTWGDIHIIRHVQYLQPPCSKYTTVYIAAV